MTLSQRDWNNYITKLSALNKTASDKVAKWVEKNGLEDTRQLLDYCYAISMKYGNGSASLSALMYDTLAELEGAMVEPAILAPLPEYGEVAKAVQGTMKTSLNPEEIGGAVGRLVKRCGADTTLYNAQRDGAEFAWIPSGDTCAFCITLASRGWQHVSKQSLKNGHAEHIHSNCDCQYAIRFNSSFNVAGYDPDKYYEQYESAEGNTPKQKINAMRRKYYQQNREEILKQKASAEEKREELNSSMAEETQVN